MMIGWSMVTFRRYRDRDIPLEVGDQYGDYEESLAVDEHGVEIHFFRKNGELNVYVTKSPGVTVAMAQRLAKLAIAEYDRASVETVRPTFRPQFSYRW